RYIRRGDVYPSTLAAALVTSPSLVSAEINRLIAAKMVTRESAEHDGRRSRLTLTAKAHEVLAESQTVYEDVLKPILEEFSESERKTFFDILEALSQDMLDASPAKDDRTRVRQLEAENRRLRQMLDGLGTRGQRKRR
ncbi:MAG: MarR family winged helix-turn-helix transcriptional regulator, partial [Steroidobacteraceae bacterium]